MGQLKGEYKVSNLFAHPSFGPSDVPLQPQTEVPSPGFPRSSTYDTSSVASVDKKSSTGTEFLTSRQVKLYSERSPDNAASEYNDGRGVLSKETAELLNVYRKRMQKVKDRLTTERKIVILQNKGGNMSSRNFGPVTQLSEGARSISVRRDIKI